jgi:hypothetical protein
MTPERMKSEIPGYYQAWADADRDAVEAYVGDPFSFTSPYDDHIDRDEYFRRCWPNAGVQESFDIKRILPDGEDGALVLYEAKLNAGKTIRNVEYMRFDGDRLRSVEVYFGLGPGEVPTSPDAWSAASEGRAE